METPSGKLRVLSLPSGPTTEELDLIARCREGDRTALGEFYSRFRPDVARNIQRVLGPGRGDLEDVLQDVFIEAFRSLTRFRGDAKLSTWLYRVCVNVALQRLRKVRRLAEVDDERLADGVSEQTPERGLDAQRRVKVIYRILDQLSPKKRIVFILHEIEGREPKEIAGIVGAPVLTVRTRLHYARKEFYRLAAAEPGLDGKRAPGEVSA
jgi:RNA polymerase sigma-70 factor (ECF subfamily)